MDLFCNKWLRLINKMTLSAYIVNPNIWRRKHLIINNFQNFTPNLIPNINPHSYPHTSDVRVEVRDLLGLKSIPNIFNVLIINQLR